MIYFTLKTGIAGFGDQIVSHYIILYKIGIGIGLNYVQSPFKSYHLTEQIENDINEFFGFFNNVDDIRNEKFKEIPKVNINILDYLQKYETYEDIRKSLYNKYKDKDVILELNKCYGFHTHINNEVKKKKKVNANYPFKENFKSAQKFRNNFSVKSPFKKHKKNTTRIIVHIRLGDTALIDLGKKKWCPLVHEELFDNFDDIQHPRKIKGKDFDNLFKEIKSEMENIKGDYEMVVVSDGYTNSPVVNKYLEDNNINKKQFYDKLYDDMFDKYKKYNPTFIIGKSHNNFFQTVLGFIEANILVSSSMGFPSNVRRFI